VGDLIDPPPYRLQVSQEVPLVFLVTRHGGLRNRLVRFGEQVGEASSASIARSRADRPPSTQADQATQQPIHSNVAIP
jgi:hypothetical protein